MSAIGVSACGGSSNAGESADAGIKYGIIYRDAGVDAQAFDSGRDYGKVSATYPAFSPDVPQILNNGGDVLTSPVFVTVTWKDDENAPAYEAFGDALGTGDYWKAITSEYGTGPGSSGPTNHVRIADYAPAMLNETDVSNLVATNVMDPTSGWPAPTSQSFYILYLPAGTMLIYGGENACYQGVGGYHYETNVNGNAVTYAVIPQCSGTALDDATSIASHELGEGSLDPHPESALGWFGFDSKHVAWKIFQDFQEETADACEFYPDIDVRGANLYLLQRQWSNASAAAGHDPCVPALATPYFNVTPLDLETFEVDLAPYGGLAKTETTGFQIAVGATKTIALGYYSDAAMEPWQIDAYEGNPLLGNSSSSGSSNLELSIDNVMGQNGQMAYLTVTVDTKGVSGLELITMVSTSGATSNYMPILILSE